MVLKAETKIRIRGGKEYKYFYVHLPSKLAEDSQFPFEEGEIVVVEIVEGGTKLCIHKREGQKDEDYLSVTWQSNTED